MPDEPQRNRPSVVWESSSDPAKPVLPVIDYATPAKPDASTSGLMFLKFFLGCFAGVGGVVLLIFILQRSNNGLLYLMVFHTMFAVGLIIPRTTRAFGIGFILGIPFSILILFAICAGFR